MVMSTTVVEKHTERTSRGSRPWPARPCTPTQPSPWPPAPPRSPTAAPPETSAALTEALDLAEQGSPSAGRSSPCALLPAVNHSGDSDSTGSVCGNLLGARYGDHGLPHDWLERVEGRPQIAALADDLAAEGVRR
ncbi:MAG: ADP-ribosylglycohydrolase family protein [Streptomyces sp.]|nr:ADP-ribosylglycohydrolase family protein [Streptomyces sp.]